MISIDFHWFSSISIDFHWFSFVFIDFHRFSKCFSTGNFWWKSIYFFMNRFRISFGISNNITGNARNAIRSVLVPSKHFWSPRVAPVNEGEQNKSSLSHSRMFPDDLEGHRPFWRTHFHFRHFLFNKCPLGVLSFPGWLTCGVDWLVIDKRILSVW